MPSGNSRYKVEELAVVENTNRGYIKSETLLRSRSWRIGFPGARRLSWVKPTFLGHEDFFGANGLYRGLWTFVGLIKFPEIIIIAGPINFRGL